MRRSLLTTMGTMAFALAVPSVAMAHHGHRHHHHKLRAKEHHAKFRLEHIGDTGTPSPPAATQPAKPEGAGTVASYVNGVLTLTLGDGSTVSGKVTSDTRIGCIQAVATLTAGTEIQPTDQDQNDDHHSWGGGDDQDEAQSTPEPPCDTSLLVAGAVVRGAELRIGLGGGEFNGVWLVR
jgi:hypothetical protein